MGDRQIRCSLAKSDQRPALPPPPQAMPMLGQPFNLMQAQAQARLMQQLPAFNMLLGPLPGVQAAPAVDSRGKAAQRPPQDPDRVARTIFVESVADNMNEQVGHGLFPAGHATSMVALVNVTWGCLPLCTVPAVHLSPALKRGVHLGGEHLWEQAKFRFRQWQLRWDSEGLPPQWQCVADCCHMWQVDRHARPLPAHLLR